MPQMPDRISSDCSSERRWETSAGIAWERLGVPKRTYMSGRLLSCTSAWAGGLPYRTRNALCAPTSYPLPFPTS